MKSRPAADRRHSIAQWVAREVLPHEPWVRSWLKRARVSAEDIDEVIQDAYCRIAGLPSIDHIDSGRAYFFSIARNLLIRRLKRQHIVPFEVIAEIDAYEDDAPSPERLAAGKLTYDKVLEIIAGLPDRCRTVVRLRKIEGWSQKRIAAHLGTTEKAVEKQVWLGVRIIRGQWDLAEKQTLERQRSSDRIEGGR